MVRLSLCLVFVFAQVCEISLIKNSGGLALHPQRPRTSIREPPGGGRKLGHGGVSLESGRRPPVPSSGCGRLRWRLLASDVLCSFPASSNPAAWTRPDGGAPLLTLLRRSQDAGSSTQGDHGRRPLPQVAENMAEGGSLWEPEDSAGWTGKCFFPFIRVTFSPDHEAAVRAVVGGRRDI